jgi:hypothetical protein
MQNLLSEQEFTERFTDAIKAYDLNPTCKEPLVMELHYGDDEPVLTLSLKEAFANYRGTPEQLTEILEPFVQDLGWTVQEPRYPSKDLYEHSLPTLRNFYLTAPTANELATDGPSLKGPIVYEDVLKAPSEYVVMQFSLFKGGVYTPLRKGDTLPCIPNNNLLSQLSLHNLALSTEHAGITATPLQFDSLKAESYLVGLGDEQYKPSIAALSCIPPVMMSLEETFKAPDGIIAIMPSIDQLIISKNTDEQSICELGMLAQQLIRRTPTPLSALVWSYKKGNLEAVQSLDLQELQELQGDDFEL